MKMSQNGPNTVPTLAQTAEKMSLQAASKLFEANTPGLRVCRPFLEGFFVRFEVKWKGYFVRFEVKL